MRRWLITASMLMLVVTACGGNSKDPLSDALDKTATERGCIDAFTKYRDDVETFDSDQREEAIKKFYAIAPVACPSHEVWDKVAKLIAPDTATDWTSRYERTATWKGQCEYVGELGIKAPACD
jgi:hypothetical protein